MHDVKLVIAQQKVRVELLQSVYEGKTGHTPFDLAERFKNKDELDKYLALFSLRTNSDITSTKDFLP